MAKSKKLIEALAHIAALEESNAALLDRARHWEGAQAQIVELYARLSRRDKQCEDLRKKAKYLAKEYMDLALTLTGVVVASNLSRAEGPFDCLSLADYDPQHIFEHFAKTIPGGGHWLYDPEAGPEKEMEKN